MIQNRCTTTVPGAVQIMVIADPQDTEGLSVKLTGLFKSMGLRVVSCTGDYPDREDPTRRKFHMLVIPARKEIK